MHAHPFHRRRALRGLAAVAAAWSAGMAVRARSAQERVAISVGGQASLYYLPLCLAEQLGYFAEEGLAVQVTDFAGGSLARDALLGGAFDVCSGAYEHTIELQASQKRFCQAFVLQGRAPQIAFGVSTRTLPDYEKPTDLRGRRIGVSAPGSSTNRIAQRVLARAGVAPDAVQWVGVGTGIGAVHALRSGAVDAMSNVEPVITMLEQSGSLRIVSDTRTLKGTIELFGGLPPAACLYAPVSFMSRRPATAQALANAIVRALKWLQTAGLPDLIRSVPTGHLMGDPALYLASFMKVRETISPDGIISENGALSALRSLAGFDGAIRTDRIDLGRTFTNEFAARAKAQFHA